MRMFDAHCHMQLLRMHCRDTKDQEEVEKSEGEVQKERMMEISASSKQREEHKTECGRLEQEGRRDGHHSIQKRVDDVSMKSLLLPQSLVRPEDVGSVVVVTPKKDGSTVVQRESQIACPQPLLPEDTSSSRLETGEADRRAEGQEKSSEQGKAERQLQSRERNFRDTKPWEDQTADGEVCPKSDKPVDSSDMIDLQYLTYSEALRLVVRRGKECGVKLLSCNGTRPLDWGEVEELARLYPETVLLNFGIHPYAVANHCSVNEDWISKLTSFLLAHRTAGLGEIGLHFAPLKWADRRSASHSTASPVDESLPPPLSALLHRHPSRMVQYHYFCRQLRIGIALRRVISIHCVRAYPLLLHCLKDALLDTARLYGQAGESVLPIDHNTKITTSPHTMTTANKGCAMMTRQLASATAPLQTQEGGETAEILEERATTMKLTEKRNHRKKVPLVRAYNPGFLLHSFTGRPETVEELAKLGCFFSFSSQIFGSKTSRESLLRVPRHLLLVETDSPDQPLPEGKRMAGVAEEESGLEKKDQTADVRRSVAPLTHPSENVDFAVSHCNSRLLVGSFGKSLNEPANLIHICAEMARLLGMPLSSVTDLTFCNAARLYSTTHGCPSFPPPPPSSSPDSLLSPTRLENSDINRSDGNANKP